MPKKNAAHRANKKAAKADKRKKRLSKRRPPGMPGSNWKPVTQGIEGLARQLHRDWYSASHHAPLFRMGQALAPGTLWTIERMQDESTGDILDHLESVGISTDAERFADRALELLSTDRFVAQDWLPCLPEGLPVHERDRVHAANAVLWERWLPDTLHDEEIGYITALADATLEQGDPTVAGPLDSLADVCRGLGDDPVRRLQRHPEGKTFVRVLLDAAWDAYEAGELEDGSVDPDDEETVLATLDLLVPGLVPELVPDLAPLRAALLGDPEKDWDDDDDDPEAGLDPDADEPTP